MAPKTPRDSLRRAGVVGLVFFAGVAVLTRTVWVPLLLAVGVAIAAYVDARSHFFHPDRARSAVSAEERPDGVPCSRRRWGSRHRARGRTRGAFGGLGGGGRGHRLLRHAHRARDRTASLTCRSSPLGAPSGYGAIQVGLGGSVVPRPGARTPATLCDAHVSPIYGREHSVCGRHGSRGVCRVWVRCLTRIADAGQRRDRRVIFIGWRPGSSHLGPPARVYRVTIDD